MPLRPLFALTSSILAAAAAVAQQAPTASVGTLDEIIVTAQKRSQRLQDVPISVSVGAGFVNSIGLTERRVLSSCNASVIFTSVRASHELGLRLA